MFATFPGTSNDGFVHFNESWVHFALVALFLLLGAGWLFYAHRLRTDRELLFGSLTFFTALTAVAAFVSVFLRRYVEDQAGEMFAILAAVSVLLLMLAASDWSRRQLLIAAAVVTVAVSLFIVRVGFESLKVPPQWQRAQIADQATADENALTREYADNVIALHDAATDAANALGGLVYGSPPPDVGGPLLTEARAIFARAYVLIAKHKADDFSTFDDLNADEDPTTPPAEIAELTTAVHTLETAESAAARVANPDELDQAICALDPPPTDVCPTGAVKEITDNDAWVTAEHLVDVRLAAYRAQVSDSSADQAALQAVLAQQPDTDADISILSAVENGPQALWHSFFHSTGPPLVPGPLGWVLLGAALLGLLSWLLRRNASQLAGPVSVTKIDSATNGDQLTATLRVAVLQNVAEPGAAPGSASTNPVTTLLGIAGGPLAPVSKILQGVLAIVGQRYGYQVVVDVTSGDLADSSLETGGAGTGVKNPAGTTSALVRVMSIANGATYASHLCESPDPVEAVRIAGLWAAGNILNRSSRIPLWAAWEAETAHALVTAKIASEHTVSSLKAALSDAPNSGILLCLLGHRYELAGQPLDAIECYARAVTAYPRYAVARYRLAIAVAAMRHDEYGWRDVTDQSDNEDSMLRAVKSALERLKIKDEKVEELLRSKAASDRNLFSDLALALLRALEDDTKRRSLLVDTLRRSERGYVLPAIPPLSRHPAARFPALVRSARQALEATKPEELEELRDDANKDGSWWQISYNAACCYAADVARTANCLKDLDPEQDSYKDARERIIARADVTADDALSLLEQTLVRPGVEQLSAKWVARDPDLAVLRAHPRFRHFTSQLRPGK